MEVTTTEIAPDVFRISVYPPDAPVNFGCFLIRDEQPTMVETGLRGMFELIKGEVERLVDPASLRHLVVPHVEADECGSLNDFLRIAPEAVPLCSVVGSLVTLPDISDRAPRAVQDGEELTLGHKTLRFIQAPWVHFWDSMLVYDVTDRVLFTSDLFMQTGNGPAIAAENLTGAVIECARFYGLLPSQRLLEAALTKIDALPVDTIACHHGSVLHGDPQRYFAAPRTQPVGDLVEAPFYAMAPGQAGGV